MRKRNLTVALALGTVATVALVVLLEASLISRGFILSAAVIGVAFCSLWILGATGHAQWIPSRYFQQWVLRYLVRRDNEARVASMIADFESAAGADCGGDARDVIYAAIKELERKNKVVMKEGLLKRIT